MKSGARRRTEAVKFLLMISIISIAAAAYGQVADCDSIEKCQEVLKTNKRSSLVHFRIAEFYFRDKNFLSSANEFRVALNGDLEPRWIEACAHLNLGKIFDVTGQRERALNEYRLAMRTGDNTRGAQDEAVKYTKDPYKVE